MCERGTIDQYPILVDIETVPPPRAASADSNTSQQPSLTSKSSKETLGPPTPPPPENRSPPLRPGSSNSQSKNHTSKTSTKDKQDSRAHAASSSASSRTTSVSRNGTGDAVSQPKRGRPEDTESPRSSKRPTVAELIEMKLKHRRELQSAKQAQEKPQEQMRPAVSSASAPQSPVHKPGRDATPHEAGSSKSSPQTSISKSANATPHEQVTQEARTSYFPDTPTSNKGKRARSTSPKIGSTQSPSRDRRVVSFADEIDEHRASSSSPARVRPVRPVEENLFLRPCPRSVPVAGHQDWYTISGLSHLNICPSCMNQIGQSRFRDYFVPSLPKPRHVKVRCSFSEPWTRLAWLQTIKKKHTDLEMLYQITRPPPGCKPCPGRTSSMQTWYRVVDPETGMNLPKFVACSACVRNIRILMPPHRDTFRWSPLVQERVCDLAVDSPRFVRYLDLLDAAANECEDKGLSAPDNTDFVDYIRRKYGIRDCRRDRLVLSVWHYIPDLPEFSICEDCYDDVVWPLAAAHKPVARMVSRTARLLPGSGPGRCREASCQLYSPRMRTRFREAVLRDDYQYLRSVALKRYDAEQRYRERQQKLLYEESKGYDRDAELRQNAEEWKKWE